MDKKFLFQILAISTTFVWEVLVVVLIGLFLGRFIDDLLGFDRPFVMVTLMVLGVAGVLRNFIVRVMRLGEKYDE